MTTIDHTQVSQHEGITRRELMKRGGALVIAFGLPSAVWTKAGNAAAPAAAAGPFPDVDPGTLGSWLAVSADGRVKLFTGKVDLGQGVDTAFAQVVADELDVAISYVDVVMGDTARTVDQGPTLSSLTIANGGPQIRGASAEARALLLAMASSKLGVPVASLKVANGVVSGGGKTIRYAELVGGQVLTAAIPAGAPPFPTPDLKDWVQGFFLQVGNAKPKDPSQYRLVGKSVPRADIPEKVTGRHTYIQDVKVAGMLHGRVIRPSALGSRLISVGKPPKGVKVVREKDFLGVVAGNEWEAIKAARTLKTRWSAWQGLPPMADLYATIRATASVDNMFAQKGDAKTALASAAKQLQASYLTPMEAHASIGPSCAVADYRDGAVTVHAGTQSPHQLRQSLATILKLSPDKVRVVWHEASGCYGRNGADLVAVDAALMSLHTGKPVRVQYSRADEFVWEPKGPAMVQDLEGGLDASEKVIAWNHEAYIPNWANFTIIGSLLAGRTAKMELPNPGWYDGPLLYTIDNKRQLAHLQGDFAEAQLNGIGLISAWLRSPAQYQLTFAMESFMDELAAAARVDPVQFRLRHLIDPRAIDVLKAVVALAHWHTRPSPAKSRPNARVVSGRGLAMSLREGTYNAEVARVKVDRETGKVRVTHVYVVQDNGLTVNPTAVHRVIEAGVVQSTSRALKEEVSFNRSNVTIDDWHSYPILTMAESPKVATKIIDRPTIPSTGVGEMSATPVAAAIANAVFDATGARIRQLPLRPARVKAAL
jgi:nicotinate dehydrogenase subunit B